MLRLNFLLLLAVMLSALYLVQTQYESRRLFTALHQATNEARNLETEYQRLQVELRAQSAPSRIESKREVRSEARPELHLQPLAGQQDTCMA